MNLKHLNLKSKSIYISLSIFVGFILLFYLIPSLNTYHSCAQQPTIRVINDEGIDENSDGFLDILKINAEFSIPRGNYTVASELHSVSTPSLIYFITKTSQRHVFFDGKDNGLDNGLELYSFVFNGSIIYNSAHDGPYLVKIVLISEDSDFQAEASYTTQAYSYNSFSPSHAQPLNPEHVPEATFGDDSITIRNKVFVVNLNRTFPEITYYYASDNGTTGKFNMKYTKVHAFQDKNNNLAFDNDESIAQANIRLHKWLIGNINIARDLAKGDYIEFDMASSLDLLDKNFIKVCEIGIKFHYFIATGNTTAIYGSYTITGGDEMKIDIVFSIPEPEKLTSLGVNSIALEHVLSDEKGMHDYRIYERTGIRTIESNSREPLRKLDSLENNSQICKLVNSSNIEHGFYSWLSHAYVEGVSDNANVTASYAVDKDLYLYLCYPFSANTTEIVHDPSVGVIESNQPYLNALNEVKNTVDKIVHQPILYTLSALCAISTIFVTMWIRKKNP
ncbi:MAG: hypothetical protein QXT63_01105 [Thermoplasmata archaeon]